MTDVLWGPFVVEKWKSLPHIKNRVATEEDVKDGVAVFYLENAAELGATPYHIDLPHCALLIDEETGLEPIVIIQAEVADDRTYIGYRPVKGGNGVCLLQDIELLDFPNEHFKS